MTNIKNENEFYKNSRPQGNKVNKNNHKSNNFSNKIKDQKNDKNLDENYIFIPTEKLEKLTYLRKEFSNLFVKNTQICFRLYEISQITGELGVSDYKFGKINEFIDETKNFLLEIDNDNTDYNLMYR